MLGLLAIVFLACCKTKQRNKEKLQAKVEVTQIKASTTTTVMDTVIKVNGAVATASEPLAEIIAGDTLKAENNGTSVVVYYNPTTKTIHAKGETKDREVAAKATKTETKFESNNVKANIKTESKEVEVKSDIGGNIKLGIVLLIASVLAGLFIYWRLKGLPFVS